MSAFPHYFKALPPGCTHIDVYRVLSLFEVSDPALQHAVKKLLCAGARGAKDQAQDIAEAIATLQRWQQMRAEEGGPNCVASAAESEAGQDFEGGPEPEFIIAPIVCPDTPDAHTLTLKIGVQSFRIGGGLDYDTREEAEWSASQLRKALASMRPPAPAPEDAERAACLARWANAPEWAVELVQFSDGSCRWRSSKSELGLRASFPAGHNLLGSARCEPRPVQGVGP